MKIIYEVRQSNKGWSEQFCFCEEQKTAEIVAKYCNKNSANNFRVIKRHLLDINDFEPYIQSAFTESSLTKNETA